MESGPEHRLPLARMDDASIRSEGRANRRTRTPPHGRDLSGYLLRERLQPSHSPEYDSPSGHHRHRARKELSPRILSLRPAIPPHVRSTQTSLGPNAERDPAGKDQRSEPRNTKP